LKSHAPVDLIFVLGGYGRVTAFGYCFNVSATPPGQPLAVRRHPTKDKICHQRLTRKSLQDRFTQV
jgi:hypothetical protein